MCIIEEYIWVYAFSIVILHYAIMSNQAIFSMFYVHLKVHDDSLNNVFPFNFKNDYCDL